jgi:RNA polymerase sigma factor (sigma-70 family)
MQNLVAPELGLCDLMSQAELKQLLHRMLGKLKARERKAIEMWMEGMSNRAIANQLKTTVGAVKMLEYRTILKLRRMLKDYSPEE